MGARQILMAGVVATAVAMPVVMAAPDHGNDTNMSSGLVREVRQATRAFHDVSVAIAAGYGSAGSCVSGPEVGAMGVHYPNPTLVGDGMLDPQRPDILIYEQQGGKLRLLGVEFIVIAQQWHSTNPAPPVLMGQHFHYVGSPNRYGLPAFYELHVWAWRDNPNGMFVDWNPAVSCEGYKGD